jgi:2-amino-4-hydroxy-6-hydroxymethyldihydropteridine diphosphokinase
LERDFALIPLAEIAPGWRHPKAGKTARELAEQMQSAVKKTDIVIA